MKNSAGCGIFVKKEQIGIRPLPSLSRPWYLCPAHKVEFYSGPTAGEVSRKTNLLISF